jgi:phosphotransferase system  glucose/maltose/N-acetylglucosamine-specific IIC component
MAVTSRSTHQVIASSAARGTIYRTVDILGMHPPMQSPYWTTLFGRGQTLLHHKDTNFTAKSSSLKS